MGKPNAIIAIGAKFNKLTVVSEEPKSKHGQRVFIFSCECGNQKPMIYSAVKSGKFKSCGCGRVENSRHLVVRKEGDKMPPGPGAASAKHWKSKFWQLKSPSEELIEGANLNQIIRDNAHLFDPMDVVWKNARCNASHGIRHLFDIKEDGSLRNNSWKGWRIGDKMKVEDRPLPPAPSMARTTDCSESPG